MLLPRVLTAVVGIPLVLFLVHCGGLAFSLFIVAVCALCSYEYAMILRIAGRPVQWMPTLLLGAALSACATMGAPLPLALTAGLTMIVLIEMAMPTHSLDRAALTLFGAVFAGWMPAHLALIRALRPHGESYLFMTLLAVWLMDTAAYAGGRSFGRRRLAAVLSPKKTWEGAACGLIAALATCVAFSKFVLAGALSTGWALSLGAAIGVFGQLSDLAQSLVKRDAGVKDSGTLLPGHGGVFDRFDSLILAAPVVYYVLAFK